MKTLNLAAVGLRPETFPNRSTTSTISRSTVAPSAKLSGPRVRTVLAPFDFSNVSAALLRRLITLAESSNATVHVLHIVEPSSSGEAPIYLRERAVAARNQIKEWVEKTFSTHVSITTTVRVGRPADEIVAQAYALYADLIVMSAHSRNNRNNGVLHTTTERVMRLSPCPVLVATRDQVPDLLNEPDAFPLRKWKRILLPVDLSSDLREVLDYAAAMVHENGARLHILHDATGATSNETHSTADARMTAWLRSELRWPVKYEASIWTNVPLLNAILHEVNHSGIDLIVLPARRCSRFRRHRLRRVTDGILRHAPCPVLSISRRGHGQERPESLNNN